MLRRNLGYLKHLKPQLRHVGYLLLAVNIYVILDLIELIIHGEVTVGYSAIPVAILLGLIFLISYILIRNPETVEWDAPYLGKFRMGENNTSGSRKEKDGFERVVTVADEESTELADSLRAIRFEFDEGTCEAVAETIIAGIESRKTSPFHQTLNRLESLLNARSFVEQSESLELRIVQRDGDRLYARVTDEHDEVKEGLQFDIYILDEINVGEATEHVSKQVAKAEVVLVDEEFCGIEILDWADDFNPSDEKMSYIISHAPEAKFDTQMIRNVDWDDIEKAHENLTQLETGGNS